MLTTTGAISRVFKRGTTIFERQLLGPFLANVFATAAQESYIVFGREYSEHENLPNRTVWKKILKRDPFFKKTVHVKNCENVAFVPGSE